MDCSEYLDMISDEIDGELGEARALNLMRHLVQCDGCRSEYSELLSLSDIIKSSAPDFPSPVPSQFSANVMALIETEVSPAREVFSHTPAKGNILGGFWDKVGTLSFPTPSLSWSFAASLMLIVSLTFFYDGTGKDLSSPQMMTDAKVIKAQVLKQVSMTAGRGESDLNYYVKKHANALRNKPVNHSIRYGSALVSSASYESRPLRNK